MNLLTDLSLWRKALQIFKKKNSCIIIASFLLIGNVLAQSLDITSPSMPSVSAPSISKGFYVPGTNTNSLFQVPSVSASSGEKTVSPKIETEIKASSDAAKLPYITSQDISALNSLGLLDSINLNSSLENSENSTTETLEMLLYKIEEVKKQNAALAEEVKNSSKSNTPAEEIVQRTSASSTIEAKKNQPKILRFSVNGYNILNTCRKIYISTEDENNSMLITGDRRYLSDGKIRSETFYIYFKPQSYSSSLSNYSYAVKVNQDYLNEYSFLYQMSKKENLTVSRTGNLLAVSSSDLNWQLDFLIDIGTN